MNSKSCPEMKTRLLKYVCVELAYETLALVLSSAVVCRLAGVNKKGGYSRMASVLRHRIGSH